MYRRTQLFVRNFPATMSMRSCVGSFGLAAVGGVLLPTAALLFFLASKPNSYLVPPVIAACFGYECLQLRRIQGQCRQSNSPGILSSA
jgi:hypothetical protein